MANKLLHIVVALATLLSFQGCSGRKDFSVELKFSSDIERTVTLTYTGPSGGIKRETAAVEKRKARLSGNAPDWTVAWLCWSNGEPVATLILRNGTHAKISISGEEPPEISVKGSRETERLRRFVADNRAMIERDDTDSLNIAVAAYISEHPDDPVSTALLACWFDSRDNTTAADSLLSLIDPKSRPQSLLMNFGITNSRQLPVNTSEKIYPFTLFTATDSLYNFRPGLRRQNLVAVLSDNAALRGRQVDSLRRLAAAADSLRLRILEISFAQDSSRWRSEIAGDSAGWIQGWVPSGAASPVLRRLSVASQPFYILIDSTGTQIYRGSSFGRARRAAFDNLSPRTSRKN
ncbi:MAG: hypothetical protein NC336_01340 [Clostridium sp.]|nr:hypothetical protein [Clostridium sp.]